MPRPVLIDFKEDGSLDIDRSLYALPPIEELAKAHGKVYVEVLARLYAYRTPINPFAPTEEREARAIADTKAKHRGVKVEPSVLKHRLFVAAVERFLVERYDPIWESFVNYEEKCDEFNRAISTTPVQEEVPLARPAKKARASAKSRKSRKLADILDDLEEDDEDIDCAEEEQTRRIDNTELLSKMNKALKEFSDRYEDLRQKVLRIKAGKAAVPQRARDFADRFKKS